MTDVFIEYMVKKKKDGKDIAIIVLLILAVIVLTYVSLLFLPSISFFVLVLSCFGAYKLITMRNLEFEYSFTNGFIAVDKIMNKSSRKRVTAFECSDVEDIGEYEKNKARLENRNVEKRIFASENPAGGPNSWFVIMNSPKTGKTLLVFDPNEKMQEAIKKAIPTHLRFEVFGRRG